LNADPEAPADCPGSLGAVELKHVCDGWPVPLGFGAADAVAAAEISIPARETVATSFRMLSSFRGK
jgi:hypothetical protein